MNYDNLKTASEAIVKTFSHYYFKKLVKAIGHTEKNGNFAPLNMADTNEMLMAGHCEVRHFR